MVLKTTHPVVFEVEKLDSRVNDNLPDKRKSYRPGVIIEDRMSKVDVAVPSIVQKSSCYFQNLVSFLAWKLMWITKNFIH